MTVISKKNHYLKKTIFIIIVVHFLAPPSPAAEMPESNWSKQGTEDDDLDGLPVFGADVEEGDLESASTQKDKQTDAGDENETGNSVTPANNEAGKLLLENAGVDGAGNLTFFYVIPSKTKHPEICSQTCAHVSHVS